jgi:hypothetical protein
MKTIQRNTTLILLTALLVGCSTTRNLPFASYSLEPVTLENLVDSIKSTENNAQFTQISKFSAEYSGMQEKSNFNGYIRMAKDSLLMMTIIPAMGVEAFRILLSPDSSKTINRIDKTYKIEAYDPENQIIPLDFHTLESLLSYNFSSTIGEEHTLTIKDGMYQIESKQDKEHYSAIKVDANYLVRELFIKDFKENRSVRILYNSFIEDETTNFPQKIEVSMQNKRDLAILRLNIKRVTFDTKMSFPFTISSKYRRTYTTEDEKKFPTR